MRIVGPSPGLQAALFARKVSRFFQEIGIAVSIGSERLISGSREPERGGVAIARTLPAVSVGRFAVAPQPTFLQLGDLQAWSLKCYPGRPTQRQGRRYSDFWQRDRERRSCIGR